MNIDITKQERNELLEREDIELEINHAGEATPSENAVRKKLAAELDLDPTTIRVDHIYSSTGRGYSTGTVTVFDEPIMDELPEDEAEVTEEAEEETGEEQASTDEESEDASDAEDDADAEEESDDEVADETEDDESEEEDDE